MTKSLQIELYRAYIITENDQSLTADLDSKTPNLNQETRSNSNSVASSDPTQDQTKPNPSYEYEANLRKDKSSQNKVWNKKLTQIAIRRVSPELFPTDPLQISCNSTPPTSFYSVKRTVGVNVPTFYKIHEHKYVLSSRHFYP